MSQFPAERNFVASHFFFVMNVYYFETNKKYGILLRNSSKKMNDGILNAVEDNRYTDNNGCKNSITIPIMQENRCYDCIFF